MLIQILMSIAFAIFLYFKVFRKKNSPMQNKFQIIVTTIYEYIFLTKEEDRLEKLKFIHEFSPRYIRLKFWKIDYVIVYDPELLKKVFNSQITCQRPFRNCFQLEKGLLASEYEYWRYSRKHLNIAFNLNVLKGFIPVFSQYTDKVIKEMEDNLDGKEFDLYVPLTRLTVRSSAATILNVHGVEMASYEKMIEAIAVFLEIIFKRMLNPILQIDSLYKFTNLHKREMKAREFAISYGDKLIEAARERKRKEKIEEDAVDENGNAIEKKEKVEYVIDQLVREDDKFTNQEIREHILVLLITASETSNKFVATTLIYLAIHQEIQKKVYQEISEILGDEDEITYEHLSDMKYLEMVLKETLRLLTPVPLTARETLDKFDLGIGRPLEKGAKIVLFNYILHRRRDIWGRDANKFNPENFSPENVSNRDAYAFVPFGLGPRGCIGARFAMISAKVETARLLRAYKFNTTLKESQIKMGLSLTGKLTCDHLVSIEKRS
ncbi:hypothetical protein PVAND_004699 [Polypedilum vanderplanki]|uniref:Cytochrome P450 n=1 Tax=Polypedilum vanderplanki TaxID=319348 RepID=A0A9J6BXX3_POLVA|nr:hypothetical protein PVAND_004699 [Polypedilum vanderplanki]